MKRILLLSALILLAMTLNVHAQQVNWLTWEEATEIIAKDNSKKVFIDVYTDWCGWCKRMDRDTFGNPEVAAYMNDHFLMVKMDGEERENMDYRGRTFKYVPSGRRGYHELPATLMRGRLSYPTVVFMDEQLNLITPVPGYHQAEPFLTIARYFGDDIYKEKDWETYSSQ